MFLNKYLTKFLSFVVTFALLVVSIVQSPAVVKADELEQIEGVEVLANNEQEIRLKTEIDGLVGILVQDQETKEITLTTYEETSEIDANPYSINALSNDENVDQFALSLEDFNEEGATITYQDQDTGQSVTIDSDESEVRPMVAFLAPLVQIVGAKLIEALLLTAAVVAINEIEFAKTDSIASKLRNKQYDHYYAKIMQKDVWIGPAISESVAVARLVSFNGDADVTGNDVWSKTQSAAARVAKKAGGNREPVGPEIHGILGMGYYYHFHTWNRVGGHSFF